MDLILAGALAMAFAVAGLFFLRFWRETGDRLFAFFALSFFVLAVNRVGLALIVHRGGEGDPLYWVRLVAFLIILVAILDKNRSSKPPR
jgi:hypothetical protein